VLLDDDGSLELFFGTVQDVTDLRRAQEDSFAMQKLESLGTLAGTAPAARAMGDSRELSGLR